MNLIYQRKRKRPNVQQVMQAFHTKIGQDRIVTAVLETFELEKQTTPGAYATGYPSQLLADRTRDFLAFAVELLFDAGHHYELAFETARKRLVHSIFGGKEPEIPVFVKGKRVDSGVRKRQDRVVRGAMEEPALQAPAIEKDAVNTAKIVLTDRSGRVLN